MLDGLDSSLYIYVLVPALSELLKAGGQSPTKGAIALAGGVMFSIFMLGWAAAMVWGWLADRIGRVRVMVLTILTYSLFTALAGLAPNLFWFGVFRFLAGFGVGGEWIAGTPFLHENVPEAMRVRLAGWLHTATPVGLLLGALLSFLVPLIGWRAMFMLGLLPALFSLYLRASVPESARDRAPRTAALGIRALLFGAEARTTWSAAAMMSCIIFGLWSSTYWIPTLIVSRLTEAGGAMATAQRLASAAGVLINLGTIAGCLAMPWIAGRIGRRRRTAALFFLGALGVNLLGYGLFVGLLGRLAPFLALLPLLGFFTNAVFALYTIWLPEMFPRAGRAAGAGFAFSLGRVLGATGPSLIGRLVATTGSYPLAISLVSLIYLVGLPFITLAPETAGQRLRE